MNLKMDAEMAWDSLIFKTPQHQKLNRYNHDESHQFNHILKQIITRLEFVTLTN